MAKQLTAPGCKYSIVARVDTTIYSPDQKWVLDVPAGQTDFIAETNEIIIPADAMMCRKKCQIDADLVRFNVLGRGAGSLATFVTRAIEQIVGKGNAKVEYGDGKLAVSLASSATSAQVAEVERLLQRLLPKDVVADIDPLPSDYIRAEFLESTGTQYILAPWAAYDEIEYTSQLRNTTHDIHCSAGCSDMAGTGIYLTEYNPSGLYCRYGVNYYYSRPNANFYSYEVHEVKIKDFKLYLNNNLFANIQRSDFEFGNSDYIGVFVRYTKSKNAVDYVYQGAIYRVSIKSKDVNVYNFIPTLDSAGIPCMFDTVTRKPFYNQGTGQFIIGLTMTQALDLANLPAPTTSNTLTVSLPWDAQWDAGVQKALATAAVKGWTITVQYRDPEVATENIPISFLESTGTQYIDTGIKNTPTSKWEVDYQSKNQSGTGFESVFGGQTSVTELRLSAIILGDNSTSRFVATRNIYSGGVCILDQDIAFSDDFPATARHIYGIDVREGIAYVDNKTIKGNPNINIYTDYPVFVMARNTAGSVSNIATGKLYGVRISEADNIIQSQVPALSPTGVPCMYDSVSGQNFYNAGTGAFIAGFDTVEQIRKLATLPDVTAETDVTKKSLTVSMPLELAFDASVKSALAVAAARGWTIIVQGRESEVATANLDADFLESNGGQYMELTAEMQMPLEATIDCTLSPKSVNNGVSNDMYYGYKKTYSGARVLFCANQGSGSLCCGVQSWLVVGRDVLMDNKRHLSVMKRRNFEEKTELVVDGTKIESPENDELAGTWAPGVPYLFALNENDNSSSFCAAKIWGFSYKHGDTIDCAMIPCLDEAGTPCMYDTVTGQNFYNQGTGSFTVGFDTTEKAAVSLSKLPVTTNGTLTVSLPAEAEDTATLVPAAIDIAKSRGWTIIEQIRTN